MGCTLHHRADDFHRLRPKDFGELPVNVFVHRIRAEQPPGPTRHPEADDEERRDGEDGIIGERSTEPESAVLQPIVERVFEQADDETPVE